MTAEIGRLCVKIAGRDAGKECLIVDIIDKNFVPVDGNTRRKKVNIDHLEMLPHKAGIKKGAAHEEVIAALKALGVKEHKKSPPKPRKEAKTETNEGKVSDKKEAKAKAKKGKK